ncbi:gamma-tocopherol methyltransferase [Colletotrichum tofieldiae]|nr:gamma-tocopherol methyltransferase [Colletotrichum tofieldiae]GKT75074.1 gamma-tocopherol methyltransferase [Colletotrichum tofieldiae]
MAAAVDNSNTELSQQYDTPLGLAHSTMQALKDRIKLHYDLASDYYLSLWGEHIHHGYWEDGSETKEQAQVKLIQLLLKISNVGENSKVLDVGCGIGGTSRYLASTLGCSVTGITISTKQVEIANRLTKAEALKDSEKPDVEADGDGFFHLGRGKVRFIELDAEKMGEFFAPEGGSFDAVWISEALSHFPNKSLFFENTFKVLKAGGKLALADWFKAEDISGTDFANDIKPIEGGRAFLSGGSKRYQQGREQDLNPSLWAFAFSQGRDGIAFLQSFRAMRRGYANGTFQYAVMSFEKLEKNIN